jgi:Uma2 family endonuclease
MGSTTGTVPTGSGYAGRMSTAHQLRYSYEDFLRALAESPFKLEYSAGVIYAMAGGTFAHGELSVRVASLISQQLPGTCRTYSSDVKVRVDAIDFAAFPDVSAGCGPRIASRVDANALTNPVLLVEVTSRSTEAYDRGEKLENYQHITSLQAVVFVSHREARLTLVERTPTGWSTQDFTRGQQLVIKSPALSLEVDRVYAGVELDV